MTRELLAPETYVSVHKAKIDAIGIGNTSVLVQFELTVRQRVIIMISFGILIIDNLAAHLLVESRLQL